MWHNWLQELKSLCSFEIVAHPEYHDIVNSEAEDVQALFKLTWAEGSVVSL